MRKKPSEPRSLERTAPSAGAKPAHEAKTREQADKEAVARAVLEALRAHDSM